MANEFDFISWLRARQPVTDLTPTPAGDDLAVLHWPGSVLVVGVDQVLDGVHFDSRQHEPRRIGRKAMNRNLSDCAAMACLPTAAVVTLALPTGRGGADYAKELYQGIEEAGAAFGCSIVGGDTGSWPHPLAITVTILARADGVEPVRRNGARPGDGLYVSGPLGGSLLGRHLDFEPRVRLARELIRRTPIHAMIDLSDGLSRDVAHLCRESGVAVEINLDAVPVHNDARRLSASDGRPPLSHALHDGEDYELLAAIPPSGEAAARELRFVRVGAFRPGEGVWGVTDGGVAPLAAQAWEHQL